MSPQSRVPTRENRCLLTESESGSHHERLALRQPSRESREVRNPPAARSKKSDGPESERMRFRQFRRNPRAIDSINEPPFFLSDASNARPSDETFIHLQRARRTRLAPHEIWRRRRFSGALFGPAALNNT